MILIRRCVALSVHFLQKSSNNVPVKQTPNPVGAGKAIIAAGLFGLRRANGW